MDFAQHLKQEKEKLGTPKFKQKQEPVRRFTDEQKKELWKRVKSKSSYIDLRKDIDKYTYL
ncbi:hypothetical protein HOR18_gp175 [Staphylococcus phage vB_SscM-1]|uniref:Uncharacterized protein n=2 Tax=Sciuriunavirus SscM1 TaxID=2734053 RepID=A0A1X9I9Z0_9CAUD|nr:hypothetical protein HOR18_gp175 [Staphylococcus phage vB_SscM-1]ANT44838.1 hypothetical protein vB_SscM-1_174 [Staphylococcus phage vB_SscM-1]ANT45040.1 hypothetical protein vB_SscM-2_173 [Staphylococcus phage vB_SscM-2]